MGEARGAIKLSRQPAGAPPSLGVKTFRAQPSPAGLSPVRPSSRPRTARIPNVSPAGALSLKARRAMVLLLLLIGLAAVIGILIPIRAGIAAHGLERLDLVGDGSDRE